VNKYPNPSPIVLPVSLRDYFAAKAMQALITGNLVSDVNTLRDPSAAEVFAKASYFMAEAMLKARDQ
jgi:hypothetical protein